jgi:hypothetical protein
MLTPNDWAPSPDHPGYRVKVIQHGACTLEILRPELDEREQAKREAHLQAVAERVLSNYYIRKEKERK